MWQHFWGLASVLYMFKCKVSVVMLTFVIRCLTLGLTLNVSSTFISESPSLGDKCTLFSSIFISESPSLGLMHHVFTTVCPLFSVPRHIPAVRAVLCETEAVHQLHEGPVRGERAVQDLRHSTYNTHCCSCLFRLLYSLNAKSCICLSIED